MVSEKQKDVAGFALALVADCVGIVTCSPPLHTLGRYWKKKYPFGSSSDDELLNN